MARPKSPKPKAARVRVQYWISAKARQRLKTVTGAFECTMEQRIEYLINKDYEANRKALLKVTA